MAQIIFHILVLQTPKCYGTVGGGPSHSSGPGRGRRGRIGGVKPSTKRTLPSGGHGEYSKKRNRSKKEGTHEQLENDVLKSDS